jgi:hypothetical protein
MFVNLMPRKVKMENRLMVQKDHLLAVFNSAHRVMKAENLLKAKSMNILLIPAPRQLQTDCGLAIRFSIEDREAVMSILEESGILPEFLSSYTGTEFITIWNHDHTIQ